MAERTQKARLPNGKRARKPLQQGHLDGLCGVYAIINAIRYVCPRVSKNHAQCLFELLNRALAKQNPARAKAGSIVFSGLNRRQMWQLIEAARQHLAFKFDVEFKAERLLLRTNKRISLAELWRLLTEPTLLGRAAVLGLSGRKTHRSVVSAATQSVAANTFV